MNFKLVSKFKPSGDQPKAIKEITGHFKTGEKELVLLGITGSGKTFTIANIIEKLKKPTLVISHNKTLAAQLYDELRAFFPENAVEYFVSFYDYYQPEAYIPSTDTYIEKDSDINDEIDRLRLAATSSLLSRRDVIIVASVSCIFGLGSPLDYEEQTVHVKTGKIMKRRELIENLVRIQYDRNDTEPGRGEFRVRGDVIEVFLAYKKFGVRIELFGDEVDSIKIFNRITKKIESVVDEFFIFPAKHFITASSNIERAIYTIRQELKERLRYFRDNEKLLEAQRLEQKTEYDIELLKEMGYCNGIENYSRHLAQRPPGSKPYTLLDYFPADYLTIIDESHQTIPQVKAMFNGDHSRKSMLVEYGFRLPSALDNRPLKFNEFQKLLKQVIYVSATPADYEITRSTGIVEQIIRPTGLMDPEIEVKPVENQIDDLINEIDKVVKKKERVLVTTLTIRMSEELTAYLKRMNIRVEYLHSKIDTLERVRVLHNLRKGDFDVLVGINLLREGLDLPEVSLVAILDADKEGFLRSETSLIQVSGRAARNVSGRVIMYADRITKSMKKAIDETNRRRELQMKHNVKYNITPETIKKGLYSDSKLLKIDKPSIISESDRATDKKELIHRLNEEMLEAAENLDFETAAEIRDIIIELRKPAKR